MIYIFSLDLCRVGLLKITLLSSFQIWIAIAINRKCKNHPDSLAIFVEGDPSGPSSENYRFFEKVISRLPRNQTRRQHKPFAPHICCKTCVQNLWDWRNKRKNSMLFGVPMVWREGKDQFTDCYFCMTNFLDLHFLTDYCWCLKRDVVSTQHNRKSLKSPFIPE